MEEHAKEETPAISGYPQRDHMDKPGTNWRYGTPNYDTVNETYMSGRTRHHAEGSMEKFVENFVKTWEMEVTHKLDINDWETVDREKFFTRQNGGQKFGLKDYIDVGNYNLSLHESPLFDSNKLTNKESFDLFQATFKRGFAWELLELISGPPVVSFTWRHWGSWEGSFGKVPPTGETLEMYGNSVVRLNDQQKILSIDVYYDPNPLIAKLTNFKGDKCPFNCTVL